MMNAFGERPSSSRNKRRFAVPAAIAAAAVAMGSAAWACTPSERDTQTRIASCTPPAGSTRPCKATLASQYPMGNATAVKGPAGSSISAFTRTGDSKNTLYDLVFADSVELSQGVACYHARTKIGGPVMSGGEFGDRPPTSGIIPQNASLGMGEVCFSDTASRTSGNFVNSTSSIPATFKVIL